MLIVQNNIEIEVVQEIWRTKDCTFVVVYPSPDVAHIKAFRGTYTKSLRDNIKEILMSKGCKEVHYERFKNGEFYKHIVRY